MNTTSFPVTGKTKTKVFINGRFLNHAITGVQRSAYELVKALDSLIDQGIISNNDFSFILIYPGIIVSPISLKHIIVQKKGWLKGNLWEQLELPLYTAGKLLVSLCSASPLLKRKQIVLIHDASCLVNPGFFSFGFRAWYNVMIPVLGKISRQIVTVSEFSKSELTRYAGIRKQKIQVIYNSAEHILRFGDVSDKFREKIAALKPYCLAVSNLGANKNFAGLNKAIGKIDALDFHMLIAGGALGGLKASATDHSHVTYLGYMSDAEIKHLYANASLFIFPSFYEGFGIPPLEAMIMGCPVIASATSSMPEILGDNCEYIDPANPADMAEKIFTTMHDAAKRAQLKSKGYQRAALFNWEKSAARLYELIRKCDD
ncbi:glycosyltransferase family 4 protein [Hufsiella ginkgonis]|uniref:Glycosyltransferase n=1 Tax=Hufsiella ginkgonis TaxID=2695274 RepID=A0A7K1Y0Y7_9SPHI|nr:glycosyltransferase family 1 protein [Hufsiella ginkgonis]MXV16699.1 glycosyltransferase [Hufsiella ginkgonis]